MGETETPIAINVTAVKRHEAAVRRLELWLIAAQLTFPILLLVSVPVGLVLNGLKIVIVLIWGNHLLRTAPYIGEGPGWDDEDDTDDSKSDWGDPGVPPEGDWDDFVPRTGLAAWI